jgi:hypothetical protein
MKACLKAGFFMYLQVFRLPADPEKAEKPGFFVLPKEPYEVSLKKQWCGRHLQGQIDEMRKVSTQR